MGSGLTAFHPIPPELVILLVELLLKPPDLAVLLKEQPAIQLELFVLLQAMPP